ncbi:MAG: hypothetical protein K1X75_01325 [Leptospirales bacterium]|nr:hypothetical protein [Leptospirales bacterium]
MAQEKRVQDHGLIQLQGGGEAGLRRAELELGARFIARVEWDYLRWNRSQLNWAFDSEVAEAALLLRYARRPFVVRTTESSEEDEGLFGGPDYGRAGEVFVVDRRLGAPYRGFQALLGRHLAISDPDGFLFVGEAPGVSADWGLGRSFLVNLGAGAWQLQRERLLRSRSDGRDNVAAFYLARASLAGRLFAINGYYGFLRFPGRATIPDLYLPGAFGQSVAVPLGQSALPDLDVHYWGLYFSRTSRAISWRAGGIYNHGREMAVDSGGVRLRQSRRAIRGGMAYGSLVFHLGLGQEGPGCEQRIPERYACVRALPIHRGPELEMAGLWSSRDRNDSDDDLRGFGAVRPSPLFLGGPASILVQGPPPGAERTALRNLQPGRTLIPTPGLSRFELLPDRIRDNVDPATPNYENGGAALGGLRLGAAPGSKFSADVYLNYARFDRGQGAEGILALSWPYAAGDVRGALSLAASGARYRSSVREIDPWSGLSKRPAARYYSRYIFALALRY